MDPNHFHYQQAMFNYMSNYQNPNPQNSQFPYVPTNSAIFFPETPIGFMSGCQVPPVSTQVGTEKEERVVVKKKSREQFTRDEDILLIQSWLNVSKDPIVGVDQKAESFWLRIAANYNQYRGQSREKLGGQLKCRWHRINGLDEGTTFNLEYVWRLLKDEPKWMGESIGNSSKITKSSASGASSDNPNTPSSYEFNSSSPMKRPMGQKAAKRKGKAKEIPNAMQDARIKRAAAIERLAQCKEDEL
ncbi:unnamed protein product [Vicia faba]|uniref:No apical meristem-associated C-terminal domain-containing protein n=1 Tax=Vicia faba TaxID=3906 RepID=A0AAV1ACU1_VICFA|nr:unnamed protein product [Vicia faba]